MTKEVEELMQQGKWDDAQHLVSQLLQVQPVNPQLNAYLGLCFFRRAEFEAAIPHFQRAVALDPQYWEAGTKLAQCLDRLQRFEEGLTVAETFLKVQPNDPTLEHLVAGLRRQVPNKITEGWERSVFLNHKHAELASDL